MIKRIKIALTELDVRHGYAARQIVEDTKDAFTEYGIILLFAIIIRIAF